MLAVIYKHRWDILWLSFKGFEGDLAFTQTPRIPHPLYTPMQPCHVMDYNESGAWRRGEEWRGGSDSWWGLEYPEKAWIQACSWKIVKKLNAVQGRIQNKVSCRRAVKILLKICEITALSWWLKLIQNAPFAIKISEKNPNAKLSTSSQISENR